MEINKPVTIIILAVIILMMAILLVLPKYQEYNHLQAVAAEKEAEFSGQSIYYARISDILAGIQSRQAVLDKIDSSLPQNFALAPLVDFLQRIGKEQGVEVGSVVFSQTAPDAVNGIPNADPTQTIKNNLFTVSATGSYAGLKNFLLAIDNSARLFETDNVDFSIMPAAKNKPLQYSMKLEIKTHTY